MVKVFHPLPVFLVSQETVSDAAPVAGSRYEKSNTGEAIPFTEKE